MPGWNEPLSVSVFISLALKSSAVLFAASLIALFLRRRSAAVRHLVWTAAFVVLFALPFFSAMPALKISVLVHFMPTEVAFHAAAAKPAMAPTTQSQSPVLSAQNPTAMQWIPNWRITLLIVWCVGTLVSLGQMLAALAAMRRIRRRSYPMAIPNFASFAASLHIKSPVELFACPQGNMPMNFGLLHQAIFLPLDVLEGDEERCHMVILHELAHVRRNDVATHILARVALSFYWWNPLAWLAWREFLKERERAADDLVLTAGARPSRYANHLLEIAASMQSPSVLAPATVAMARRSQLEGRLVAILESGRNRSDVQSLSVVLGIVLAILIAAPLGALQSRERPASSPPADFAKSIRLAEQQKQPEVLDEAAKAAERLSNYDLARQLLEASLNLRARLSGQQSLAYGIGLLHLADLEREQGKLNEARPLYTKAIRLLGNSQDAVTALIHMGSMALINKNTREAVDDFSRAQSLNAADGGRLDMWMAIAQEQEGFVAQADSWYQSALRKCDPNPALAATIMELYAQFLSRQGRVADAQPLRERSSALRKALGAQALAVTQNTSGDVYKIGGDVTTPVLLSKVEPEYSQEARAAKYQGSVLLYAEVGADGLAHNAKVSRGLGLGLNEKAIQAVSQWKFKPSTKDGQPVTVQVNIEVNFRLL